MKTHDSPVFSNKRKIVEDHVSNNNANQIHGIFRAVVCPEAQARERVKVLNFAELLQVVAVVVVAVVVMEAIYFYVT